MHNLESEKILKILRNQDTQKLDNFFYQNLLNEVSQLLNEKGNEKTQLTEAEFLNILVQIYEQASVLDRLKMLYQISPLINQILVVHQLQSPHIPKSLTLLKNIESLLISTTTTQKFILKLLFTATP